MQTAKKHLSGSALENAKNWRPMILFLTGTQVKRIKHTDTYCQQEEASSDLLSRFYKSRRGRKLMKEYSIEKRFWHDKKNHSLTGKSILELDPEDFINHQTEIRPKKKSLKYSKFIFSEFSSIVKIDMKKHTGKKEVKALPEEAKTLYEFLGKYKITKIKRSKKEDKCIKHNCDKKSHDDHRHTLADKKIATPSNLTDTKKKPVVEITRLADKHNNSILKNLLTGKRIEHREKTNKKSSDSVQLSEEIVNSCPEEEIVNSRPEKRTKWTYLPSPEESSEPLQKSLKELAHIVKRIGAQELLKMRYAPSTPVKDMHNPRQKMTLISAVASFPNMFDPTIQRDNSYLTTRKRFRYGNSYRCFICHRDTNIRYGKISVFANEHFAFGSKCPVTIIDILRKTKKEITHLEKARGKKRSNTNISFTFESKGPVILMETLTKPKQEIDHLEERPCTKHATYP